MRLSTFLALVMLMARARASYNERDPCPRGRYKASPRDPCSPCPRGTYGHSTGLTACAQSCPPGTYSDILGASTQADCLQCPPGTYNILAGAESCTPCPAGRHSAMSGLTSPANCLTCVTGYYDGMACRPNNVARTEATRKTHAMLDKLAPTISAIPLTKTRQ